MATGLGSHSSSMQSMSMAGNDETSDRRLNPTGPMNSNLSASMTNLPSRNSHSLFAKLTDAKKSLFGRATTPDPSFTSADENKALLSYLLSEPQPQLEVIQEFERNGAQLNAITDESNTAIHILARAELHSAECINIVDYLIKKGCDPSKQNDHGWTAGRTTNPHRLTDTRSPSSSLRSGQSQYRSRCLSPQSHD